MRKVFSIFILINFVLISCGPSAEAIFSQTADASTAIAANWTGTTTAMLTPTETLTPSPETENGQLVISPERPNAGDGLYTPEQLSLIESDKFVDQEQTLADWAKNVWSAGNDPVFNKETTKLKFVYMFDPDKPDTAGVCLQSPDFSNFCMIPPIDSNAGNGFLPTPTEVINGDIPMGHEPTMLDINMNADTVTEFRLPEDCVDSKLGWENGVWVRYSTDGSKLVASLSVEGAGAWVGPDYAERYTPVWSEDYIGKVGDIEIPIYFGITENVIRPTDKELTETVLNLPPIKKFILTARRLLMLQPISLCMLVTIVTL